MCVRHTRGALRNQRHDNHSDQRLGDVPAYDERGNEGRNRQVLFSLSVRSVDILEFLRIKFQESIRGLFSIIGGWVKIGGWWGRSSLSPSMVNDFFFNFFNEKRNDFEKIVVARFFNLIIFLSKIMFEKTMLV